MMRLLAPIHRRIATLINRVVLDAIHSDEALQAATVTILAGEVQKLVHLEPYGFTSSPHPGADGLVLNVAGQRGAAVVINLANRQYRLKGLKTGEAALFDDQGQVVLLTRDGILVKSPKNLRLEADEISLHAVKRWSWDVGGYGMAYTVNGNAVDIHTWQDGATVTFKTSAMNPPEGP